MTTTTPPAPAPNPTIERPAEPAADLDALFPGRFLSITSFKRDGTGVATPVWAVSDGARLFAFTDLHSPKIWRMRRDPHVMVAPCLPGGKLRGDQLQARAEILTDPADFERVQKLLLARYKISYRVVMAFYRLGRAVRGKQTGADAAVVAITLE